VHTAISPEYQECVEKSIGQAAKQFQVQGDFLILVFTITLPVTRATIFFRREDFFLGFSSRLRFVPERFFPSVPCSTVLCFRLAFEPSDFPGS